MRSEPRGKARRRTIPPVILRGKSGMNFAIYFLGRRQCRRNIMTNESINYIEQLLGSQVALAHDPGLLLCVVPADEIREDNALKIMNLLRRATAQSDKALILVNPDSLIFGFAPQESGEMLDRSESIGMEALAEPAMNSAEERPNLCAAS